MKVYSLIVLLAVLCSMQVCAGDIRLVEENSYAQEYAHLNDLLKKVQNRQSAVTYKSQIAQELDRLKSIQISGEREFKALSEEERQAFIKKFQNNQFHCGEVTSVMQERYRLLLNAEIKKELGPLLNSIP